MPRLCERPGCGEPATVAYGFDAGRQVVWFDTLRGDGPQAGRLCRRHAQSMVVPKGWWLDDRREAEALFPAAPAAPATPADEPAVTPRPKRTRRSPAPVAAEAGTAAESGWTPIFDATDDLDGQLNATTPLLARAFGQGPVRPAPTKRGRKRPPDTAVG